MEEATQSRPAISSSLSDMVALMLLLHPCSDRKWHVSHTSCNFSGNIPPLQSVACIPAEQGTAKLASLQQLSSVVKFRQDYHVQAPSISNYSSTSPPRLSTNYGIYKITLFTSNRSIARNVLLKQSHHPLSCNSAANSDSNSSMSQQMEDAHKFASRTTHRTES